MILNREQLDRIFKNVDFDNLPIFENADRKEYLKWKRLNVTVRGISDDADGDLSAGNGNGAMLGLGLYTAPLGNKSMAASYGKVHFVLNGRPKNPIKFKSVNAWEIWFYNTLVFQYSKKAGKDYPDRRDFSKNTTIEDEVQKLGYDGIEIVGREIVNFKPENVLYFSNERQLENYYDTVISGK